MTTRTIDRLLAYAAEHDLSQTELACQIGISTAVLTNWKRRGMPPGRLQEVAVSLGIDVNVLLGNQSPLPPGATPVTFRLRRIPVSQSLPVTKPGVFEKMIKFTQPEGFIEVPSKDPDAYVIRVDGTGLSPRIQNGEYVVVEPRRQAVSGDEVVVLLHTGDVQIRRLLYTRADLTYLASINDISISDAIKSHDIQSLHPILAIVSSNLWTEF